MAEYETVSYKKLKDFAKNVMIKMSCWEKEAEITAIVLTEANLRGIHSHGVARLKRYVDHIKSCIIEVNRDPEIVYDTPISATIDGKSGVGQYISECAMNLCLKKAENIGFGIVTVKNSNHYGIAGYYAEKALKSNMMGFSTTNTAPLSVPTFGVNMLLGTNPMAIAIPTNYKYPILIDMSTTVVPRGKLEVYDRLGRDIPLGWATDDKGKSITNPKEVLDNMLNKAGGGLLPLGGEGEMHSGHKGYGLNLLVELLTGGLSGGAFSYETYKEKGRISHTFVALKLDLFANPSDIIENVTRLTEDIRQSKKAQGQKRIYIHGEKEYEKREQSLKSGIELDKATIEMLKDLADDIDIDFNII